MSKKSENLELLLDFGVDEKSRTIILTGDVDEDMLHNLEIGMCQLEKLADTMIFIRLNTGGGDVSYGLSIIDRILTSKCEVHIHASGEICSMGIPILAAGTVRTASPLTSFMWHESSYKVSDRHANNKNYVKYNEKLDDKICRWMATRTKKDYKFWKALGVKQDYWFFAEEAHDMGLIDEQV
jgi:ATP-dependent protease ClpP protease subunit